MIQNCCSLASEADTDAHNIACVNHFSHLPEPPMIWAGFVDDKLVSPLFTDGGSDAQTKAIAWLGEQYCENGCLDNPVKYYNGPKVWAYVNRYMQVVMVKELEVR